MAFNNVWKSDCFQIRVGWQVFFMSHRIAKRSCLMKGLGGTRESLFEGHEPGGGGGFVNDVT